MARMNQTRRHGAAVQTSWPRPARFQVESLCCKHEADEHDILYSGSDDDGYAEPRERQLAYEKHARRFIEGKPVALLSATLRGPFDAHSGWNNPWRSRKASVTTKAATKKRKAAQEEKRSQKRKRSTEQDLQIEVGGKTAQVVIQDSFYLPSPDTTASPTYIDHKYLDDESFIRVKSWAEAVAAPPCIGSAANASPRQTSPTCIDDEGEPNSDTAGDVSNIINGHPTQETAHLLFEHIKNTRDGSLGSATSTSEHCSSKTIQPSRRSPEPSRLGSPTKPSLLPLNTADFSPRAVKIYEEMAERGSAHGGSSQPIRHLHDRTPVSQTTPLSVVAAAALPLAEGNGDSSFQTCSDRSFRFRSKAGRVKRKPKTVLTQADIIPELGNLKPEVEKCRNDRVEARTSTSPESTHRDDQGAARDIVKTEHPEPVVSSGPEPIASDLPICDERDTTAIKDSPLPENEPDLSIHKLRSEQHLITEEDAGPASSPIDFLSKFGSFKSPESNIISLGAFSFEKQSQAFLVDLTAVPRKLLWPRSQTTDNQISPDNPVCAPPSEPPRLNRSEDEPKRPGHSGQPDCEQQAGIPVAVPTTEAAPAAPVPEVVSNPEEPVSENSKVEGEKRDQITADDAETVEGGVESRVIPEDSAEPTPHLTKPQEQSPQGKGTAELPILPEQQKTLVHEADAPARIPEEQHENPLEAQTPWALTVETVLPTSAVTPSPDPEATNLTPVAHQALNMMSQQSPWAKASSQTSGFVNPKDLNIRSSPLTSPCLPKAPYVDFTCQESLPNDDSEMLDAPRAPVTPERYNSSLPTPDFTLSIKSFREFMTPSPAKRTPLGPTDSNGRLPSTQVLTNAAISNPWANPSRSQRARHPQRISLGSCLSQRKTTKQKKPKRVSWNLRGDGRSTLDAEPNTTLPTSSPGTAVAATSLPKVESPRRPRAASPPPSSLVRPDQLPKEDQKFGKHFAAVVANRRRQGGRQKRGSGTCDTPMPRVKKGVRLLPSESQQVCPSPAAEAMAEAFIRADDETRWDEEVKPRAEATTEISRGAAWTEYMDAETAAAAETEMEIDPHTATQESVDDVTAVLENLDEFLDTWDVDTELAKARAEEREKREKRTQDLELDSNTMATAADLMDVGVWD